MNTVPQALQRMTLIAAAISLTACATIMGSPVQNLPIASTPSDAKIVITDETGAEVFNGQTPTSVTLNKSTGKYFGGKSFTVTISKPGFRTQAMPLTTSPTGWYLAGNFLFGGLIGWFVVDPLNGNMYKLSAESISVSMAADGVAQNNKSNDGSVAIMLLADVPSHLRGKLVKLN